MQKLRNGQQGVSISGLLVVCVVLGLLAILAAKIVPEVSEFMDIKRETNALAADPALRGASLRDVKTAFRKRAEVSYIKSITADDLDIYKDGEDIVVSFEYSKTIPLFANASLLLDFKGSTSPSE